MKVKPYQEAWENILGQIPETAQPVLETFSSTGLAEISQIITFTNLTRDKVNRAVERMESQGLLREFGRPIPRPDKRGSPPAVYLLTDTGARVLHSLGHPQARASGLTEDLVILHRLAMTDIHLAAVKAGLAIRTDKTLKFEDDILRPDHLITLPNGELLLFEIEQAASTATLRRIVESLQNKQDFFASKPNALPEVRMILQLPRGGKWDRTLKTWVKALGVVQEKAKGQLNFRLFAIPRPEFLDAPDWGSERKLSWREVRPPQKAAEIQDALELVPQVFLNRTSQEDRLVLKALWQDFIENVKPAQDQRPRPDPEFFQIIHLIHSASHDINLPLIDQAAMPYASLYLMKKYLTMRKLDGVVKGALHRGARDTRWNITTINHRMQAVINAFLNAHGWRSDGLLSVYAKVSDWENTNSRVFDVKVTIKSAEILMSRDDLIVPSKTEIMEIELALSWALWSLFEYSADLGLGRIDFW